MLNDLSPKPKRRKSTAVDLNISLYIILLAFFIVLSSSSSIDVVKVSKFISGVDKYILNNEQQSRSFIGGKSFFNETRLSKNLQSLVNIAKENKSIEMFVGDNTLLLRFKKGTLYKSGELMDDDLFILIGRILVKINTAFEERDRPKLSFIIDSNIEDMGLDISRLNFAIDLFKFYDFQRGGQLKYLISMNPMSNKIANVSLSLDF